MEIRKKDATLLDVATSTYTDWIGTSVAENSMITGSGDLYELAGLDGEPDRWSILGIDVTAFSHGEEPTWSIRFYAADRVELGVKKFEDWGAVAEKHGGVPVVDILLHEADFDDVIKCMKLVGVQFRNGHFKHQLLHSAYADFPEQEA
ncbi:hypothetical protein M3697_02595 [Janibacter melonis]|uniref:hypothetical protein n=1 Tax=Janibacter melonis TaxID=262209 RepID=UPI00204415C8|nr:hypothetical protein [Janibacter melonis]MCM3554004.1 hypothetical protein [Janibacter melonis]